MASIDYSFQNIDWWHEDIGEGFDHSGILYSSVVNPSLTIGLSDYINMTITPTIGKRVMEYPGDLTSHHRTEDSHSDFINAIGGMTGDTRVLFRYLVLNDGIQGNRLFIGSGLVIPSKNSLTADPYFLGQINPDTNQPYLMKDMPEHRHFSMSEGTYQLIGELQFFRKLSSPIIFWGLASSISHPIKESQYGFLSSTQLDFSLTFLTQKLRFLNASMGLYLQYKYSSNSRWNEIIVPNSKSSFLNPGFGFVWTTKNKSGIALNILFPQLLTGDLASIESNTKQQLDVTQISVGFRKTFDYIIPFLD